MSSDTKHEIARNIARKCGLDPYNPDYVSEGGTVTREFYKDVAEAHGAYVPDDANKDEVADIAVEAAGGDPNRTWTSNGGTETKITLMELDRVISED